MVRSIDLYIFLSIFRLESYMYIMMSQLFPSMQNKLSKNEGLTSNNKFTVQ